MSISFNLRLETLEARDVPAFVNPVTSGSGHNLVVDVNGDGKADPSRRGRPGGQFVGPAGHRARLLP